MAWSSCIDKKKVSAVNMSAIRFEGDSLSNLTETRNATNEVVVQYQGLLSPINKPQLSYLSSYCLLIACASTSSPLQSLLMLQTPVVAVTYVCMPVITISINLRTLSMKGCVGETGASCYNFHSNSIFHENMQARDFFWT